VGGWADGDYARVIALGSCPIMTSPRCHLAITKSVKSAAFSAFSPNLSSFHGLLVACGLCSRPNYCDTTRSRRSASGKFA
jgi:hypothetical protein